MGRFYDGDIKGKFWFGVQDSEDIENLVNVTPNIEYSWHACNCVAEINSCEYCRYCYDSKEAHIEEAIEAGEYDDKCLYYEESSCGYNLDKESHLQELQESMAKLKKELPVDILHQFDTILRNDNILDAFTGVFDHIHSNMKNTSKYAILARYTFGYQIEYCLQTNSSCSISCEI
jgi:hypothetical protein